MVFPKIIPLCALLCISFVTKAQTTVDINFDVNHVLNNVDSFDREKFITCHSDASDNDFRGEMDKLDYLINDLDVYFGRETGRMRYQSNQVAEDPNRPGYASPADITAKGTIAKRNYSNRTDRHPFEKGALMTAAQDVPFYPNGANDTQQGWAFSQENTTAVPFGTATGEFMGRFMRDFHGTGGTDGNPRPKWVEVMNEPVWPLVDFNLHGGGTIEDIFTMHSAVADEIRKYSPETKIGGFTTAFPNLEVPGKVDTTPFGQWEERWKRFIDEVGAKMDFYSIHLYDFPGINNGLEKYRKGSNMEATMDMIEHYNTIKYGDVKPWIISEYGSQFHDWFNQPWSPDRDWLFLKAQSSMMMQFMERADVIDKTMPFAVMKAEWGFGNFSDNGVPYYSRMMRRANEPESYTGDWVWTEFIKAYELWSDVKGMRVDTKSSNLDIMVDAYIDSDKAYVILNNISEANSTITLNELGLNGNTISGLKIKHLYLGFDNAPKLDTTNYSTPPEMVTVNKESCMILEYTLENAMTINESSKELKTYATTYKQAINANQPVVFTFSNIEKGSFGEAMLRLGVGREKSKSRLAVVSVNGNAIDVPTNYRGDNQEDRDTFFGVLEIPVPYTNIVAGTNTVSVSFPDDGGTISSAALQTFEFSKEITRSVASVERDRSLIFNNRASYYVDDVATPVVKFGQDATLNITYTTGIDPEGTEEDLTYVATQVRQMDENNNRVGISAFTTSVPGVSDNTGTVGYIYTIPEKFNDDTPIPSTAKLPEGHRLELVIFMSVDNATGFADATDEIIIEESSLSVDDINKGSQNTIQLFPNPSNDTIFIKGDFKAWKLYSLAGQLLEEGNAKNVSIAKFPSGIYYLNFDGKKEGIKLVKY